MFNPSEKPYDSNMLSSILALQQQVAMVPLKSSDVMNLIVNMAQQLTHADAGVVAVMQGDEMVYTAASGTAVRFLGIRLRLSHGLSGLALATREAQICHDCETDPRVDSEAARRLGIRSMIIVPLRYEDTVPAVLKVGSARVGAFTDEQVRVLMLMSGLLGSALGRAADSEAKIEAIRILEDKERQSTAFKKELELQVAERTLQLAEHAQRLEHALSAAQMNTWEWDFASNKVDRWYTYNSPKQAELPSSIGLNFDLVHPDDRLRVQQLFERAQDPGEDFRADYQLIIQGKTRWMNTSGRIVRDLDGKPVRAAGVTMDVTSQHETEFKMRVMEQEQHFIEVREQAAQEALEMKSAFLAGVSHELRNPLHGILGMGELLADTPLNAEQADFVAQLRRRSETLVRLVDDILDLSKAQAGKIELENTPFDVRDVLDDATAGPGYTCQKKGLGLKTNVSPTVPPLLLGDSTRISQLLLNLISNAVKFTTEGDVAVNVWGELVRETFVLTVEVEDTGIGIPASAQAAVFEPFVQADSSITRRFGGTGLGLSICKHLVELMGGQIGVRSKPTVGSTFWFTLPLQQVQLSEVSVSVEPQVMAVCQHLRILVAEDDSVNQLIARRMLEKMGHEVTIVDTGTAAVAACESGSYDLVLMDGQMPEMNGLDATRRIRAHGHDSHVLPIIAMTGNAMADDKQRCLDAGMNAYVSKPINLRALSEVIARTVMPVVAEL